MIAVVAPMEREVARLRKRMTIAKETDHTGEPGGGPVRIHIIGAGKEKALESITALLERNASPDFILCLGYAGALSEELRTGDLVIARRLFCQGEDAFLECDTHLIEMAQRALNAHNMPRHYVADSVTTSRVACTLAEKVALAATGAEVVDMEDYWVGTACGERDVPFLSVRAVLDTARQELPRFIGDLTSKGTPMQVLHLLANSITRPQDLPRLAKLAGQATVAQESLAAFGLAYLPMAAAMGTAAVATRGFHE